MTPLLHKPVSYGSARADAAFLALVVVHYVPAGIAPVAGIVAMASTKGMKRHLFAGKVFLWTMVATAVSGIILDSIRLTVAVPANHEKLPGMSMPKRRRQRYASTRRCRQRDRRAPPVRRRGRRAEVCERSCLRASVIPRQVNTV